MTTTKKTTQTNKAGYVTNKNYYRTRLTDAAVWMVVCLMVYFMGISQGDTGCHLEVVEATAITQQKVFNNDLEISNDLPNVRNISAWAERMRSSNSFFAH